MLEKILLVSLKKGLFRIKEIYLKQKNKNQKKNQRMNQKMNQKKNQKKKESKNLSNILRINQKL